MYFCNNTTTAGDSSMATHSLYERLFFIIIWNCKTFCQTPVLTIPSASWNTHNDGRGFFRLYLHLVAFNYDELIARLIITMSVCIPSSHARIAPPHRGTVGRRLFNRSVTFIHKLLCHWILFVTVSCTPKELCTFDSGEFYEYIAGLFQCHWHNHQVVLA